MDVLPFNNYPVVLRLRGREIREILEHGVSEAGGHGGKFLQVSGLRYVHDPSAPSGSRVREIEIGGRPVELERFYTVATNDFLTAGGDGHAVFRRAFPEQAAHPDWKPEGPDCRVVLYDRSRSIQEMVIHALQKEKKIMAAPEGRIQVQRGGANHADLDK